MENFKWVLKIAGGILLAGFIATAAKMAYEKMMVEETKPKDEETTA